MSLFERRCPSCNSSEFKGHSRYRVLNGEVRWIYRCLTCGRYFSETKHTFLERLRTPLSRIAMILDALNEGMAINAACRVFKVSKNSIYTWLDRLGSLKETLLLYALCHQFLVQLVEGDELYTRVHENKPADASEGWTVVLMDRASRFIWELCCGQKTQSLFEQAIQILGQVIEQTDDLSLLTDGERRYGSCLFDICGEVIRTGKVGRPPTTLKKGYACVSRTKASRSISEDASVPSIKRPSGNTPILRRSLIYRRFMPTIWRPSTVPCGVCWPVIDDAPTPMPRSNRLYSVD